MMRFQTVSILFGAAALAFGGTAGVAQAQSQDGADKRTPKSWNYVIKDGKRVPKANRVTNPDGSWREVIRQGNCVTIKEKTAQGVYKETRDCD